uniref:Uncharacterized protein n=1 Tax=Anguilla anguilla TaxID=7936 RepID=A0A0E9S5T6_ANGAN
MKAMNWPKNEEADVCNWQLTTENIALKKQENNCTRKTYLSLNL